MSIFQRAFLYLTRKKARSLLMFLLLFFMSLSMLAGLSIRNSAGRAAQDMRKSISSGLELQMVEVPGDAIYATGYNENGELVRTLKRPLITESVAQELASIPGVSGYYSQMGSTMLYTGLNVVPGLYTGELEQLREKPEKADSETIASAHAWSKADDYLTVQESEYHPYFRNGAFELIAGRHLHIDDTRKILVPEELAARNGLEIGDAIDGRCFDAITGELYGETYRAEIVGIYRINFEQQLSEWTPEPKILANMIIGPFEMRYWDQVQYHTHYGGDVLAKEDDRLLGSITLFVDDPAELDGIEALITANPHVDWTLYNIQRYDADYKAAAKPLLSLTMFATGMVAVMIAGTLLILSLVLAMQMRGRKHEMDVLTYIGTSRRGILTQFLIEMGALGIAAFLAAWLLASPVTSAIGNAMLRIANPAKEAASFSTTYEATTGMTYISREAVYQDALSYPLSFGTSIATFLSMAVVAFGTVALTFQRMQSAALLSRKGSEVHHWRFQGISDRGALKARHRAFLYVTRKTGKSALLLLTLTVIIGLSLCGISIRFASEHAAAQLRESLGGYFKVAPDYRRSEVVNQIDLALVKRIAESENIEAANAMDVCYMDVLDSSLIPGKFSAEGDEKSRMTRILGNTDSSLHEYFSLDIFELVEGEHIAGSGAGQALISRALAQANRLNVGDHLAVCAPGDAVNEGASGKTYDLEIVGLFSEEQPSLSEASQTPECDIPQNFIFTDISTTQQMMHDAMPEAAQVYSGGAIFFVKDPERMEEVLQTLADDGIIDENLTTITVNNASYERSMKPLERLSSLSLIMLAMIVGIGVILLTLILTLWERDRIHETGILMSFGILTRDIWWQRFLECACIFVIALMISATTLLPVAADVGDWLYAEASAKTEQMVARDGETGTMAWELERMESIEDNIVFEMKLAPATVALAGLGGLILVGGAMSTAFFSSARRKPKELLATME